MALMKFREPNQVQWQGVRPGHNGTQVLESFSTALVVPTPFYTVPAGKTFFLTYAGLFQSINITGRLILDIYTDAPAYWRRLLTGLSLLNQISLAINVSYWPPIEVPAGYIFYVEQSAIAGVLAVIHGWVE